MIQDNVALSSKPIFQAQEGKKSDSWEEEFDKKFGYESELETGETVLRLDSWTLADHAKDWIRTKKVEWETSAMLRATAYQKLIYKEARTLALQEAAAIVRSMKEKPHERLGYTGERLVRESALEDAAREIEELHKAI